MLAEFCDVLRGELAEMPEAVGERAVLDLGGLVAGEQLPPHHPEPARAQVAMQAHATDPGHRSVHGADRDVQAGGKLVGVDRLTEIGGKNLLDAVDDVNAGLERMEVRE